MKEDAITTYTVVDVETPNSRNDSICALGLVHVENNEIVSKEYFLVNPEDRFDPINMHIHGISKSAVADQPKFPEIWSKISGFFTNGIIVAHNASFDLNVISKTLKNYHIDVPDFYYVCTLKLSRRLVSGSSHFGLSDLCSLLDIELNEHHNALSDAVACQKVFEYISLKNTNTFAEVETYHLRDEYTNKLEKPLLVKSLNTLYGLVMGITCDKVINELEIQRIDEWIREYEKFSDSPPYSEIYPRINEILQDRLITEDEREILIHISQEYLQEESYSKVTLSMQILKGIVEGISCDKKIVLDELDSLKEWMEGNLNLRGNYPYDAILLCIEKIIEDRIITSEEHDELLSLFKEYTNPIEARRDLQIDLANKSVCLTGNFIHGTKEEIGTIITGKGGFISPNITKKTEILLVGGEGSKAWCYGNFGSKVKKAMEMRSQGIGIEIYGEEDFINMVKRENMRS